jgi:hypothetical protein
MSRSIVCEEATKTSDGVSELRRRAYEVDAELLNMHTCHFHLTASAGRPFIILLMRCVMKANFWSVFHFPLFDVVAAH